ncbi:MAG: alpha-hydroxy acid oxidase [Candidatus Binatia bacterium]
MSTTPRPINLFEFEAVAKGRLPKTEYDYIAGGATDEISVQRNRRAFESIALRPRVLTDVSHLDLSTTVLGHKVNLPVLLAPSGGHKKAHPEGELATYRAAAAFGTVMAVSAHASVTFEKLAKAAKGRLWLQLYPFRDREMTKSWLSRAKKAGYTALCITLDSQWPPKRERNIRNNYKRTRSINYPSTGPEEALKLDPHGSSPQPQRGGGDPAATWKDLEWIKSQTDLPFVVKGIMTGEDVEHCAQVGVDAVIISNHGGRHLDNTLATIEVLPEAVAIAKGRVEILLDGGIRRGADVVKALALGAKAVFIGRPLFWGLAVNGEQGVTQVLDILREEMEITMAKCGKPTIGSIDSTVVVKAPPL